MNPQTMSCVAHPLKLGWQLRENVLRGGGHFGEEAVADVDDWESGLARRVLQRGPLILGDSRESMRFAATEEWSILIIAGLFRDSGAGHAVYHGSDESPLMFLLNRADN